MITEIRPERGWLDLDLAAVWRYRELLGFLVWRELKLRYKQAAIGVAWAVLQPVLAAAIFTAVFGLFARLPSDGAPYALFAFTGLLAWTYFAEVLRRASTGLVDDAELVRKIYFPRLVLPLASLVAPLVDLVCALPVLAALMLWYGVPWSAAMLTAPAFVVMAGLVAMAVGLWLGPINVRMRDVKHALPFLLQVWMYASPVVYPLSMVPEGWRTLFALNPMVGVVEGFRWAVLGTAAPDWRPLAIGASVTLALLVGGLIHFKRAERGFADVI